LDSPIVGSSNVGKNSIGSYWI